MYLGLTMPGFNLSSSYTVPWRVDCIIISAGRWSRAGFRRIRKLGLIWRILDVDIASSCSVIDVMLRRRRNGWIAQVDTVPGIRYENVAGKDRTGQIDGISRLIAQPGIDRRHWVHVRNPLSLLASLPNHVRAVVNNVGGSCGIRDQFVCWNANNKWPKAI